MSTSTSAPATRSLLAPEADQTMTPFVRAVVSIDAVGSGLVGATLLAVPSLFADAFAVGHGLLRTLGVVFIVNAWVVARPLLRLTRARLRTTGIVDAAFVPVAAAAAFALPDGAAAWTSWFVGAIALLSVGLTTAKLGAARHTRP